MASKYLLFSDEWCWSACKERLRWQTSLCSVGSAFRR